mmetsp:Transcript_57445/g.154968  ORF Transcript_57445/g.154968 Transcript_57445/m.154968 type:complete len:86 (-) Transcript_57445:129-386(-)
MMTLPFPVTSTKESTGTVNREPPPDFCPRGPWSAYILKELCGVTSGLPYAPLLPLLWIFMDNALPACKLLALVGTDPCREAGMDP